MSGRRRVKRNASAREGQPSRGGACLLAAVFLCSGTPLVGHQAYLSFWKVQVEPPYVRSQILVSILDLDLLAELDANSNGALEEGEILQGRAAIEQRVAEHYRIRNAGATGEVEVTQFRLLPGDNVELEVTQRFSAAIDVLELESTFHLLTDDRHRVLCRVELGTGAEQLIFDHRHPRQRVTVHAGDRGPRNWARYFILGVEHLVTGYDHIAFLIGLIIVGGSLGSLAILISSFTMAHSLTLALSTLGVVSLSEPLVEAAIALSVCFIALENLLVRKPQRRWVVTFLIGLVHGLGFSHVLREMELPREELIGSLLSFNAGLEVAQVLVLLVLFPVILVIQRQRWQAAAVPATSSTILVLGIVWLLETLAL